MKVLQGQERLFKIFWLYGFVINWILPFVIGAILHGLLSPEKPENIWFQVFFISVIYNIFYNYWCWKNKDNRSEQGITAFAAMVWVSWPFVLAITGIIFANFFGTPEML